MKTVGNSTDCFLSSLWKLLLDVGISWPLTSSFSIKKLEVTAALEYKRLKLALGELGRQNVAEEFAERVQTRLKVKRSLPLLANCERGQGIKISVVFDPWFKNLTKYGIVDAHVMVNSSASLKVKLLRLQGSIYCRISASSNAGGRVLLVSLPI